MNYTVYGTGTYDGPTQAWSYATYRAADGTVFTLPIDVRGERITFSEAP